MPLQRAVGEPRQVSPGALVETVICEIAIHACFIREDALAADLFHERPAE
jgi:hypothetical protein